MKPMLSIPPAIIILAILFAEIFILFIPLAILFFVTDKDYSRSWMVKWAEKPLAYCGIKL